MAETAHKFGKEVESQIAKVCIDIEYETGKRNSAAEADDFEAMIDLVEGESTEEEYDWHSNIRLPIYSSMFQTQMSQYAATYFQTREYVNVFLQDGSPEARKRALAAKECINRTLNQRHMHYFQKYLRAQGFRELNRNAVWRVWWERKDRPVVTGFKKRTEIVPSMSEMMPDETREVTEPVIEDEPIVDRFNCDVIDPRNVFMSDEYVYSLQDKRYVYILCEKTLEDFKKEAALMGFFNLDLLEKVNSPLETEASRSSFNKDDAKGKAEAPKNGPYDYIEGYKKDWVIVTERDPMTDEPMKAEPGYDELGKVREDAEMQEIVVGFAVSGSTRVLVRWHLTPYVDVTGQPFRPLVRDLLFIHPTKDGGYSTGKGAREISAAINDTFNVSNDAVLLATTPTLKGNKYAIEDNDTIRIEPGHIMELFNTTDVEQFRFQANPQAAMMQISKLEGHLQQSQAIYNTTMGQLPGDSSTTATAIAGAEGHSTARGNYKALTSEFTGLCELYWMILQMTAKFAHPKTGEKLMGEKVYDLDPNSDYIYKPLTQAIETESSRGAYIKTLMSLFGYIAQIPNPNTPKLLNRVVRRLFEYMGDEYEEFKGDLLDEQAPTQPPTGGGQSAPPAISASNQNSMVMSPMEEGAREAMRGGV